MNNTANTRGVVLSSVDYCDQANAEKALGMFGVPHGNAALDAALVEAAASVVTGIVLSIAGAVHVDPLQSYIAAAAAASPDLVHVVVESDREAVTTTVATRSGRALDTSVALVRSGESIDISVGGGATITRVSAAGAGVVSDGAAAALVAIAAPSAGTIVVSGVDALGRPFTRDFHVIVDAPAPPAVLTTSGRAPRRLGGTLRAAQSDTLAANVAWPYAVGTLKVVRASTGQELALPCAASTIGVGTHSLVATTSLDGCVPTSVTTCVVVGGTIAAPQLHMSHPMPEVAVCHRQRIEAGATVFALPEARLEAFVPGYVFGVMVTVCDSDTGAELATSDTIIDGWVDLTPALRRMGRITKGCKLRVVASAAGAEAGETALTLCVGRTCATPSLETPLSTRTLYAQACGPPLRVCVPDAAHPDASQRGVLLVCLPPAGDGSPGGVVTVIPSETGVAEVPSAALMTGRVSMRHRRLGCHPSPPLELNVELDAALARPVVTSRGRALDDANCYVLGTEGIELGGLRVEGAAVTLSVDGQAPVTIHELPTRVLEVPGAGRRVLSISVDAPGMRCPPPLRLIVDAAASDATPELASRQPAAGGGARVHMTSGEVLAFAPAGTTIPGAAVDVRSPARARRVGVWPTDYGVRYSVFASCVFVLVSFLRHAFLFLFP